MVGGAVFVGEPPAFEIIENVVHVRAHSGGDDLEWCMPIGVFRDACKLAEYALWAWESEMAGAIPIRRGKG